jgi:hypothetical protein
MSTTIMPPSSNIGWCPYCRSQIEIPQAQAHPVIPCPGCARMVAVCAAVDFRPPSRRRNRVICLVVAILAVLTLSFLGYWFRGHLSSGFGFVADATGGKTTAALSLALILFILVCAFFWMIFPIVVYFGLKDLRRRTAELDQTSRLCVRHLAQLAVNQEVSKPKTTPEQKLEYGVED